MTTAPDPDLMFLLSFASHVLTTELNAGLAELGISPRAYCVLHNALGGDLTQKQLAERCDLDKTTMVVTVDELEQAGLALRQASTSDRRAHIISVTDAGQRTVTRAHEIVTGIQDDVLGALPAEQRSAFVDALERLVSSGGRLSAPVQCERPVRRRSPRAA